MNKHRILKYFVVASLVLLLTITGAVALMLNSNPASAESTAPVTLMENSTVVSSPFTEAVKRVHGSVVGVNNYANYSGYNGGPYYGFGGFDFGFGGFGNDFSPYGGGREDEGSNRQVLQGSGSGVVVANGFVLTNYHVVEDASALEVTAGEATYPATLAGYDESLDIAVLKVDNLPIEPVVLGDSDALNVGDWAICIGNPLSFTGTTTVGVISALNREIESTGTDPYGRKTNEVNLMIQTDAAINSGNSGGGMFNVAGELVGIPSLKYTGSFYSSASIEGIGMAIPINVAKPLLREVVEKHNSSPEETISQNAAASNGMEPSVKPRMGVVVTTINASNSSWVANGALPTGAYLTEVEAGSPAEKAGLKAGDIIVEVDGTIVTTSSEMVNLLQNKQAGDTAQIKYFRLSGDPESYTSYDDVDGEYYDVTVELVILDTAQP
mgnify:CR=1 FL=1